MDLVLPALALLALYAGCRWLGAAPRLGTLAALAFAGSSVDLLLAAGA